MKRSVADARESERGRARSAEHRRIPEIILALHREGRARVGQRARGRVQERDLFRGGARNGYRGRRGRRQAERLRVEAQGPFGLRVPEVNDEAGVVDGNVERRGGSTVACSRGIKGSVSAAA